MSIGAFEGFEFYDNWGNTEQDVFCRREIWDGGEGSIDGLDTQVRNNGHAMRLHTPVVSTVTNYEVIYIEGGGFFKANQTDAIIGFAFNCGSVGHASDSIPRIMSIYGGTTVSVKNVNCVVSPIHNTSGIDFDLQVSFGNGVDITSLVIPNVQPSIWHYLELSIKTTGATRLIVKLNGSVQGDIAGPAEWTIPFHSIHLHALKDGYQPGGVWFDDMYVLDPLDASDGAAFQDFLGPIQIRPCPLISDSTPSEWTASGGGAKYLEVDEQPGTNDLDATYISTLTAPDTQAFRCSPYDADLPIIAMTSFACVKQPDPTNGVAQLAFMVDTQEDTYPGPLQSVYRLFSQNYVTLPGGSLTVPVIEATDWGVRSLASP